MKIAFINQPVDAVIPPHQNSLGIWTYQVARRLAAECEAVVYAKWTRTQRRWDADESMRFRLIQSMPNRLVQKLTRLASRLYRNPKRPLFATSFYYLDYIFQVALDLRRQGCDVVHIHNFSQFVPVVRRLNPGVKIVLHMNCEWLSQLDEKIVQKRMGKVDLVLGSSEYISNKIRWRFPAFAARCRTVFNGVDTAVFKPDGVDTSQPAATGRLLFTGRVSPEKGVHLLVDAFPQVAERYAEARLRVVGPVGALPLEYTVGLSEEVEIRRLRQFYDGDYLSVLKKRLPATLAKRVIFVGGIPHSLIARDYRQADVLINPSFSESFGMSLVEAMASGTPVVATRVGGMPEVIEEGRTGLFVERGDTRGLADATLRLLADGELRRKMGQAGRERVLELFSWEKIVTSLLTAYNTVI